MIPALRSSRYAWARPVLLGLVPLLLLLCGLRSLPPENAGQRAGQRQVYEVPKFRTVVVLLDSLGTPMAFDPALMPFVSSLMSSSLYGEAESCPGKATFPCVKSIFEGRTATTGTTLQDFSAVASERTTWPASLAALGQRLVLTSDHTINRLYPDAFVDSMNYENLHVPILERDGYAYEAARRWLADPSIDVLLLHIIGTDKVSHEHPVGGDVYRAKYLEADNFVREVAARLGPQDYLYVLGDHGHNELGGHTADAAYLAHGPLFRPGRNENLGAADMLFLLSVPYALTLPHEYEGHFRTDLTLLPNESREKLLQEQARLWGISTEGRESNDLEARLNEHVQHAREEGQREQGLNTIWRVGPWLLAAALFLFSELKPWGGERTRLTLSESAAVGLLGLGIALGLAGISEGGWLAAAAAAWCCVHQLGTERTIGALSALALLGVIAFWVTPAGLEWFHVRKHQPVAWSVFYPLALIAGLALSLSMGATSWRLHAVRALLVTATALWLLAYFGPYNYALTGRGPKVVLMILAPLAVLLAGGIRPFFSISSLGLAGMVPFLTFHTSSFNIEYRITDRIAEMPDWFRVAACILAGAFFVASICVRESERPLLRWTRLCLIGGVCIACWLLVCVVLFQFDAGKLVGVLLGSLGLTAFLWLFQRARLPFAWSALAGAIMVFAIFHFVLNGYALSHVDFRFAANKIFPFQEEVLRAPQLILWVLVKYLFVLLPPLAVLLRAVGKDAALLVLQLGCWRELIIVLSALGLSIFDPRGVDELCSEEIYFWTFLNFALWLLCLASAWWHRPFARAEPKALRPSNAQSLARAT
ncbi:MAG: alkaline phosphatase family protein [Verrucomicrobiota bacterium]|nr:alkaline phosphatase family protein [Verrucomicrobiota bacterium]